MQCSPSTDNMMLFDLFISFVNHVSISGSHVDYPSHHSCWFNIIIKLKTVKYLTVQFTFAKISKSLSSWVTHRIKNMKRKIKLLIKRTCLISFCRPVKICKKGLNRECFGKCTYTTMRKKILDIRLMTCEVPHVLWGDFQVRLMLMRLNLLLTLHTVCSV